MTTTMTRWGRPHLFDAAHTLLTLIVDRHPTDIAEVDQIRELLTQVTRTNLDTPSRTAPAPVELRELITRQLDTPSPPHTDRDAATRSQLIRRIATADLYVLCATLEHPTVDPDVATMLASCFGLIHAAGLDSETGATADAFAIDRALWPLVCELGNHGLSLDDIFLAVALTN